ncbi:VanZ family protein [Agrococcus jenensis]|uniref:VanZ like protein n=1 Tax=Agrococcus jenensis TaxID=46353 RepID=A0A3N2AS61_9MICO|nr:VanZ family protein [Agrococcus jenensis]ROR65883.1 VanZ like protein [Agrococcus jenensis]
MLSTLLAAYPWLAFALLAAAVVVGPALGWWLAPRPRAAWALAALAGVAVLVTTLYPTGREVELVCVLGRDGTLAGPEPLANVALFVPIGLLVGVASRRPALGALAGAVLTVGIELVQALAPALGRSCAVDDAIANTVGAALGAVLAAAVLLVARRRTPREDAAALR